MEICIKAKTDCGKYDFQQGQRHGIVTEASHSDSTITHLQYGAYAVENEKSFLSVLHSSMQWLSIRIFLSSAYLRIIVE